jgi:anti-sigma regulatory factor (Ser/Thr protein kinase)
VTSASFTLLPVMRSSVSARETLRAVLGTWADEGIRADAALLLTELVANCVRHARSAMVIRLTVEPDLLRAEVRDGSVLNPLPREPDEHGGRGVLILDALASSWGVVEHPGAGKTVWFELAGCGLAASAVRVAS